MKYIYYLGGVLLGALILVLSPHSLPSAHAEEQFPRLDSWAPAQLGSHTLNGAHITIQGQMWPNQSYGLSAYLFDRQTLTRVPLQTISYTPLAERMVVMVPDYVAKPTSTRAYDLAIVTINGTQTIASNAILVEVDAPSVATPPSGGGVSEPLTEVVPPVLPTPSTDITADTTGGPWISGYTQNQVWSADNGCTVTINGGGWPISSYGLVAYLFNPDTGLRVDLETVSYSPDGGRMIVKTHNYTTNTTVGWYDLVLMTNNGQRTTIKHAAQYLG